MRAYFLLVVSVLCSVFGPLAHSAADLYTLSLEQLSQLKVISPTRHEEKLIDVPSTIYVVDANQIRQHGYRDLKDILRAVPGVEYADPHSWLQGGQRGFAGNWSKTKLMIDGVEVNLLYSGEAFIGHQFMTDNIERVEIIQGPGSSLYGADAFAGIINIVTKTAARLATGSGINIRADVGADDFSGTHMSLSSTQAYKGLSVNFFIGAYSLNDTDYSDYVVSEDFSEPQPNRDVRTDLLVSGEEPYEDKNRALHIDLSPVWHISDTQKLSAKALYLKDRDGGGLESPEISMQNFRSLRDQRLLHLSYEHSFPEIDIKWRIKYDYHNSDELNDLNFREVVEGGLSPVYIFDIVDSTNRALETQVDFGSAESRGYTIIGAGAHDRNLPVPEFREKYGDQTVITNFESLAPYTTQEIRYVFVQTQYAVLSDQLRFTLGARKDDHNIYDAPLTIRSGLNFNLNEQSVVKFNYGEAFRSPTMFELETNAQLGPAALKNYELSFLHEDDRYSAQVALYRTDVEDLIVTVFDSSQTENFISANEGEARIEGMEANVSGRHGAFRNRFWVNWTNVSDQENIARWKMGASSTYFISEKSSIALQGRYQSGVFTEYLNQDFEPEYLHLDGFVVFDLHWSIAKVLGYEGLDASLSVRNVGNADNRYPNVRGNDPKGFKLQSTNYSFGIAWRM
ncbi:MAG: TonB-dependent receptor [Agarilytica sp.]